MVDIYMLFQFDFLCLKSMLQGLVFKAEYFHCFNVASIVFPITSVTVHRKAPLQI